MANLQAQSGESASLAQRTRQHTKFHRCVYMTSNHSSPVSQILRALTSRLALDAGVSLQEVAGACEGFSGADLSALLADAQLEAVHEVLARSGGADEVRAQAQRMQPFYDCCIVMS